jgi:hypothetical protein
MTTTCLPVEAYYELNMRLGNSEPPKLEQRNPVVSELLEDLGCRIANSRDWEGAYLLVFGHKAYQEDYPCIDFSLENAGSWRDSAKKFVAAFVMADNFVWENMHRLYPHQYREAVPALCYALYSWSERRECPLPPLGKEGAVKLLRWAGFSPLADWFAAKY